MKYERRDLVTTKPEYGNRTFVIAEVLTTGYHAVCVKSKRRYKLNDDYIAGKTGRAAEDSPFLAADVFDPEELERFCRQQAALSPQDAPKWTFLSKMYPGATLLLFHRTTVVPTRFVRLNMSHPVTPIRAKIGHRDFDFRLRALDLSLQPN